MILNIWGYKIEISFLFIASTTALLIFDKTGIVFMGLFASLIHEFGHIAMMKIKGYPANHIVFSTFKINIIDYNKHSHSHRDEMLILLSGPLLNLILGIALPFLYRFFSYKSLMYFSFENLFLAIFNLIPIVSLDGGDILLILLNKKLEPQKVKRIMKIISFIIVIPILIIGVCVFIKSKYNISVLALGIYLSFVIALNKDF